MSRSHLGARYDLLETLISVAMSHFKKKMVRTDNTLTIIYELESNQTVFAFLIPSLNRVSPVIKKLYKTALLRSKSKA